MRLVGSSASRSPAKAADSSMPQIPDRVALRQSTRRGSTTWAKRAYPARAQGLTTITGSDATPRRTGPTPTESSSGVSPASAVRLAMQRVSCRTPRRRLRRRSEVPDARSRASAGASRSSAHRGARRARRTGRLRPTGRGPPRHGRGARRLKSDAQPVCLARRTARRCSRSVAVASSTRPADLASRMRRSARPL
jgi:hypothetical protein